MLREEYVIKTERETYKTSHDNLRWPSGFGFGTPMLEVSSSIPHASESKGFAFWVELVSPGLPSAGYLFCVVCEL